ncbi:MAG: S24 family peptidase [Lactococcus lactis]
MNKISNTQQRLKEIMEERGLKQVDIMKKSEKYKAELNIKMPKNYLSQYVNGKSTPDNLRLVLLSKVLGVSEAWLMGYDVPRSDSESDKKEYPLIDETIETMKRLEEPRQESVLKFAKVQLDRQNFDNSKLINMKHFTRENRKPKYTAVETIERVSAGFGFHYGENEKEIYYTLRTDLPKFDFATVVVGDSMEPLLHDGDVILIRQSYDVPQGGIYVVDYDETSWVKEVTLEDDVLILHSVNEKYRDRFLPVPAEDGEYWSIVGEVVDWFTPEMV